MEYLLHYVKTYDEVPTCAAVDNNPDYPSSNTFIRQFGSWNDALRSVGLAPRTKKSPTYTREQLLEHLVTLNKELGRVPSNKDLRESRGPSITTYIRRFGGLDVALKQAGLTPRPRNHEYSDEELLSIIRLAKEIHGRVPGSAEWSEKCDGFPVFSTYYRRFQKPWSEIIELAFSSKECET